MIGVDMNGMASSGAVRAMVAGARWLVEELYPCLSVDSQQDHKVKYKIWGMRLILLCSIRYVLAHV
jgi:hypothetical protein